jgi:hypothetical protein
LHTDCIAVSVLEVRATASLIVPNEHVATRVTPLPRTIESLVFTGHTVCPLENLPDERRTRPHMSIVFCTKTLEETRTQLEKMTDAQLTEHGKTLRTFCRPTPGHGINKGWLMQLTEARAEWRRRHPSTVRETQKSL